MDIGSESLLGLSPPLMNPDEWTKVSPGLTLRWVQLLALASIFYARWLTGWLTNPIFCQHNFHDYWNIQLCYRESCFRKHIQGWCSTVAPPLWPYQFLNYWKTFLLLGHSLGLLIVRYHLSTFLHISAIKRSLMSGTAWEPPGPAHSLWLIPDSYQLLNINILPVYICWRAEISERIISFLFHCLILPSMSGQSGMFITLIICNFGVKQT